MLDIGVKGYLIGKIYINILRFLCFRVFQVRRYDLENICQLREWKGKGVVEDVINLQDFEVIVKNVVFNERWRSIIDNVKNREEKKWFIFYRNFFGVVEQY